MTSIGDVPSHGPFGMYGPPPCRKRKVRVTGWSAQMYSAFVGAVAPGQDGMRRALFPLVMQPERLLPVTGFESAGFDRCAISLFASRPGRKTSTLRSSWAVDCGNRGCDFQAWLQSGVI